MKKAHILGAMCACAMFSATASASTIAFGVDSSPFGGIVTNSGDQSVGYSFTVNAAAIDVTSLGLWDLNNDGFSAAHQVGIWNASGTLLTSTSFASGSGATLLDSFRYQSITPLQLTAGTYTIGANMNNEGWLWATTITNLSGDVSYGVDLVNQTDPGFLRPDVSGTRSNVSAI